MVYVTSEYEIEKRRTLWFESQEDYIAARVTCHLVGHVEVGSFFCQRCGEFLTQVYTVTGRTRAAIKQQNVQR